MTKIYKKRSGWPILLKPTEKAGDGLYLKTVLTQKSIFCHNLAQMSLLLLLRLIVFNAVKWLALNGSIKHCCQ